MIRRIAIAVTILVAALAALDPALAQSNPFGRPPQIATEPGIFGWIQTIQADFYAQLRRGLIALRNGDAGALVTFLGLAFAYGVFHAAGPGHGKAVISSYIVANGTTIRRGILLSALSSLAQALVAIIGVSVLAGLIGTTARTLDNAVRWIEILAYSAIALMGLRLVWTKGRAFFARISAWRSGRPVAGLDCDDGCVHLPPAEQISRAIKPGDWAQIILATGLRPCSGAILVLVFSLSQGIYWAGIAATFAMAVGTAVTIAAIAALSAGFKQLAVRLAAARPGGMTLVLSLAELLAAVLITLFGIGLLSGQIVAERALGF